MSKEPMNPPWERIHCWPWVHLMYHDQSDQILIWIIPRESTCNSRQRVLLWFVLLQQDFLKLVVMKDWKTNTWWQCQMILCTQTVAVVGREKTHLWCCVILSTPTCLGRGSFLVKQLLQFGTGVLIRSVLYHSVKYFIWSQIYIFALYYLMIFPKIPYYSLILLLLYWCWKDLPGHTPPPPPRFFQV